MKTFNDLTPDEQNKFKRGIVELIGIEQECLWRYRTNDVIEVATEANDFILTTTSSSSLVAEWDDKIKEWQRRLI